jgi:hypothetical protein
MEKQFKDTKVGIFLAKVAPKILDIVGDIFPPAKILSALVDKEDLPVPERMELEKLIKEYEDKERIEYLADVKDARDMQKTALNQEDRFSKRFIYIFTIVSVAMGFAYIFLITFCTIPPSSQRFADTILGVVISIIFGTIYNFFYGTSKSSADKSKTIENLIKS